MSDILEKVELGEEFTPVPQEQVDAALKGEAPTATANQETTSEPAAEPLQDSPVETPPTESPTEKTEQPTVVLPRDESGNVVFSEEMTKEITEKAKEAHPAASQQEIDQAVEEQKRLINELSPSQNEETPSSLDAPSAPMETSSIPLEQARPVVNAYLKEQTEGSFEDVDALLKANQELQEKVDFDFIHPSVKKLNEVLSRGGQLDEAGMYNFIKAQSANYDNMDHYDLISEIYRMEEPGISDEEIYENLDKFHVILNNNQQQLDELVENEEITESRINALISEFARMGDNAYRTLKERQENLAVSLLPTQEEIDAQRAKVDEQNKKVIDSFNQQVEEKISTFNSDKIRIGNDANQNPVFLDYSIDPARKAEIKAAANNINDFIANRFINKDTGAIDFQKMFSDINLWLDRDQILASATAQIANQRKKDTVALFNNYSFLEQAQSGSSSTPILSEEDQITNKMIEIHAPHGSRR